MKPLFIDLIWIVSIAAVTVLIVVLGPAPLELQFHDTYVVVTQSQLFYVTFLDLILLTFLVRQVKDKFSRRSSNIILLCVSVLSIFVTSVIVNLILAL